MTRSQNLAPLVISLASCIRDMRHATNDLTQAASIPTRPKILRGADALLDIADMVRTDKVIHIPII